MHAPALKPTRQQDALELAYLELRAALGVFQKSLPDLNAEQRAQIKRQAQREYALGTHILKSPEARDVVVPASRVEEAVAEIAARYADEESFLADLARNGMDRTSLRTALERELRVEAVLELIGAAAEVNDVDIVLYYQSHPNRFQRPETRTARHILITINPAFPENTRAAARTRMEALVTRLDRCPESFPDLAAQFSECPTALQGGLLGQVPCGKLYAELDAVLFNLRPGEISGITESPLGLHLLLCEQVHEGRAFSLDKARPYIRKVLQERSKRLLQRQWLAGLIASFDAKAV